MCPGSVAPSSSRCMAPAAPETRPTSMMQKQPQYDTPECNQWIPPLPGPASETSSSSEEDPETDAEEQASVHASWSPTSPPVSEPHSTDDPPVWVSTPIPQKPPPPATRALLQQEYEVYPEEVEKYLRYLPDGKPTSERQKQFVDDLRTLLHGVPKTPYRRLVHSLPPELQPKLRKLQAGSYTISRTENRWALKEQHQQDRQEILNLSAQVNSLTQDNRDLQRQLAAYQELQQEVELLRDQVASYRLLRMAGMSAYAPDNQ